MINTIVFISRSGTGKGTQVKILSDKTGFKTFASGNRFRGLAKEDTPIGKKIKEVIDAGIFLPSWLPVYLFQNELLNLPLEEGIIFDGIVRKTAQAEAFEEVMNWLNRDYIVIHLDVSEETILKWLEKRRVAEGRADDSLEGIKSRFSEFEKYTLPALEFLREKVKVIDINGDQPMEKVSADIWDAMQKVRG